MNMIRHLLTAAFLALGFGLAFGKPEQWTWPDMGGAYVVEGITLCADARPWSYILCFLIAIALWMTRKVY